MPVPVSRQRRPSHPNRCADKQGPHPSTCPLLKPRQPQTVSLKHPGGCPAGARRAAASPALRRDRGSMRHHLSNHSQPADISLISGIVIRLQRRKKYVREPPSAHAGQTPGGGTAGHASPLLRVYPTQTPHSQYLAQRKDGPFKL